VRDVDDAHDAAGKGADALDRRPQLAAALAAARAAKCSVLVSKLDRLSRDVAFYPAVLTHGPNRCSLRGSRSML
jgi:DNA invertase Pin-like site-specific DNA recombinase